jgi:hypothetical protein
MGNETVAPSKADSILAAAAQQIQKRNNSATAESQPVPEFLQQMRKLMDPPLEKKYGPLADVGTPEAPVESEIASTVIKIHLADLQKVVPAAQKPIVKVVQVLPRKASPTDVTVAHIVAIFPVGEVSRAWNQMLQNTPIPSTVTVLSVQAQLQERSPDGKWSEPKPVAVVRAPLVDAQNKEIPIPSVPGYNGRNDEEVRQGIRGVLEAQNAIIEPEYWDIYWPPIQSWVSWRVNLPRTPVSAWATAEDKIAVVRTPAGPGAQPLNPTEESGGRPMPVPNRPRNYDEEVPARPATAKPAAPGEMSAKPEAGLAGPPEATPVPSLRVQMEKGSLLVWLHQEGLEPSKEYRYRVRLKLLNPLLTFDTDVPDKKDAQVADIDSPWSEWSEPIHPQLATNFFLVGASPAQGQVRVVVFAYSMGQRVRQTFTVGPGEPIGGIRQVSLVNPATLQKTSQDVDFSTGCVAIDFNFDKRVRRGNIIRPTVEMLYLDNSGKLRSRVGVLDEESEAYKEMAKQAEQAERVLSPAVIPSPTITPPPGASGGSGAGGPARRSGRNME